MPEIVLASTSPRRRQLLAQIGIDFVVVAPDLEEVLDPAVAPETLAIQLALGKARSVADGRPDQIVIGADTFISFQGELVGKPTSPDHAVQTLRRLRGQKNTVVTGWAVLCGGRQLTGVSRSDVWLNDISDDDIDAYVATGEPLDKAGSYAVSGIGAIFVDHINGSIDATIGLPLGPVARALQSFDASIF